MLLVPPDSAVKSRRSSSFDFGELGYDLLEGLGEAINVPLEILSRPAYGLSEALGEAREGGGPLEIGSAAWRGISGGRRRFPSVGEQLSPENRGLATGIDLFADPLLFIPSAKATRAGVTALRGTRFGGAVGKRIGAAKGLLRASPELQRLSRWVLPLRTQLSFGSKYGRAIALKASRAAQSQSLETARRERSLIQEANRLGLADESQSLRRKLAAEHLFSGGARQGLSTGDLAVDEFAQFLQKEFDDAADLVDSTGLFPAFKREPHYFPQMLQAELIEALESGDLATIQRYATAAGITASKVKDFGRSPSQAVANLAKMLRVSKEEAEDVWRFNTGRPLRAGHIEVPRSGLIPKALLEFDPMKVVPRYFNQANRRIAYGLEFGKDFEKLDSLLEKAKGAGMIDEIAGEVRQAIRDPISPEGTFLSKRFARKLMGGMIVSKMGITSSIANLSQSVNTAIVDGGANFIRGVFRARDPAARAQAVVAYHHNLKQHLEQMLGVSEMPIFDVKGLRWLDPNRYLTWVGFNTTETINRILAATSGVTTAERLAKKALAAGRSLPTRELVKRGVHRREFAYFQRFGKFSEKGTELIGLKAAERTQHATNYLEIPLGWRSPEMRLMTQYKSFIYQQSKFITREILRPAARYFAGHSDGSLSPLLRSAVAFGVAGEVVAGLRAIIRGDDKRKFDNNHPIASIMRDASYVGAFGMASDITDSALRGKLGEYFLGPTFGEGFDVATDLARFAAEPEVPSFEDVSEQLYRRFLRGPLPVLSRYAEK